MLNDDIPDLIQKKLDNRVPTQTDRDEALHTALGFLFVIIILFLIFIIPKCFN